MTIQINTPVQVFTSAGWRFGVIVALEDPNNPSDGLGIAILSFNLGTGAASWSVSRGYQRSAVGTDWKFLHFTTDVTVSVSATADATTTSESAT